MLSAPTRMAPAASRRSISGWSASAGARSRLILEPASVGRPATSNRFFTANGTPASGPSALPPARAASRARALASARSAVTAVKELSTASRALMRASAASTTAVAPVSPVATAAAISDTELHGSMALSLEHRGRLGLVGELELGHQGAEPQRDGQIGLHRRFPLRLYGQVQRLGRRIDEVVEMGVVGRHAHSSFVGWVSAAARNPTSHRICWVTGFALTQPTRTYTGGCGM